MYYNKTFFRSTYNMPPLSHGSCRPIHPAVDLALVNALALRARGRAEFEPAVDRYFSTSSIKVL